VIDEAVLVARFADNLFAAVVAGHRHRILAELNVLVDDNDGWKLSMKRGGHNLNKLIMQMTRCRRCPHSSGRTIFSRTHKSTHDTHFAAVAAAADTPAMAAVAAAVVAGKSAVASAWDTVRAVAAVGSSCTKHSDSSLRDLRVVPMVRSWLRCMTADLGSLRESGIEQFRKLQTRRMTLIYPFSSREKNISQSKRQQTFGWCEKSREEVASWCRRRWVHMSLNLWRLNDKKNEFIIFIFIFSTLNKKKLKLRWTDN
jgi:hypothetical protein